jgi:16S rRNA (guanine1207-N2)-methyltransferase
LKSMLAAVGENFTVERATSVKGFRIIRIRRGPLP